MMSVDIPNKREEDRAVWTKAKDLVRERLKAMNEDVPLPELVGLVKAQCDFKNADSAERVIGVLKDHGSIHIVRKVDGVEHYAFGPAIGDVKIEFSHPVVEAAPENMPPPEPKNLTINTTEVLNKSEGTLTIGCEEIKKKYVCQVQGCDFSTDDPHGYSGHMARHSGRPRKTGFKKKKTLIKEARLSQDQAIQAARKKLALETASKILTKADEELSKAFTPDVIAALEMVSVMMEKAGYECDNKGPLELRDCLKATLAIEGK